jgi:TRAP-type C4-dicarboxylate transport system substrate-binding protein
VKKGLLASLMLVALLALPLVGACSDTDAEVITLTYSNFFPSTHLNSILAEEWIEEIESRTDGRVKIDYFPGGTLTSSTLIYDGVVEGMSDIGMSCLAYTPGVFRSASWWIYPMPTPTAGWRRW